ncbi:MAG: septal ring lytic transglycosylase RlpA family protein [Candidatus Riflebacteria bacterium]|nr:septal ring lytic transglycosylase RlpA family protein [Candidatus Riflebacteria bacterium]
MKKNILLFICILLVFGMVGCSNNSGGDNSTSISPGVFQEGVAYWYVANSTASGEPYDLHALTAMHRTLPFGTLVEVDNLDNGRSVVVKINDRGPSDPNKIIALSYAAANEIGIVGSTTANVNLKIVKEV